jgi:hypothetical protein
MLWKKKNEIVKKKNPKKKKQMNQIQLQQIIAKL